MWPLCLADLWGIEEWRRNTCSSAVQKSPQKGKVSKIQVTLIFWTPFYGNSLHIDCKITENNGNVWKPDSRERKERLFLYSGKASRFTVVRPCQIFVYAVKIHRFIVWLGCTLIIQPSSTSLYMAFAWSAYNEC